MNLRVWAVFAHFSVSKRGDAKISRGRQDHDRRQAKERLKGPQDYE
ncbi:MAG: hypothetical protein AAGO57_09275 [Pseudomonadota bacterium]